MNSYFTRREFLKTAGTTVSLALLGESLFDVTPVLASPSYVRRDVGGMDASDPILVSCGKAIKAMQQMPSTNPLSWTYQAAIHHTALAGSFPGWNGCQHGSYLFWPWHRMYLYWFERIIRKLADDPCWALPYWNYSSPSERQLPAPFRDSASALYTVNRGPGMNDGTGSLAQSAVDYSNGFILANFGGSNPPGATWSIENTPHDMVHGGVGGWMGSIATAAQDPIFFLHHANIDRLWNLWLAQGGGRLDPLGDPTWKNTKFVFFDENGHQVEMSSCEILRAQQQLGYAYEGEPSQINEYCLEIKVPPLRFEQEIMVHLPVPPEVLEAKQVSFPIDIKELRPRLAAVVENKSQTLFLDLDGVEAERPPGITWEVYVGLPTNSVPDAKSPYYVGNVVLFSTGIRSNIHHEFKPARFVFAINRAVSAALKSNDDRLLVTFVPRGILINGKPSQPEVQSPVRIGSASLMVETQKRPE